MEHKLTKKKLLHYLTVENVAGTFVILEKKSNSNSVVSTLSVIIPSN